MNDTKYYNGIISYDQYGRVIDKIDRAITVIEAKSIFNITKYKIYKLIKNKTIKALKVKNSYRIDKDYLDKLFK